MDIDKYFQEIDKVEEVKGDMARNKKFVATKIRNRSVIRRQPDGRTTVMDVSDFLDSYPDRV